MKKVITPAYIALGLATLIFGLAAPPVLAATTTSNTTNVGQALEIAPPLLTLQANPGQTLQAQLELRNITKVNLQVTNEIDDFVAEGEGGTPKILTGSQDVNDPFTMKNWITPLPAFMLSPNNIQTVNVTIKVPVNASPGGHYGVIRFTGIPPSLKGTGVSLSASLGALVLLTVNGNITHNLSVKSFAVSKGTGGPGSVFESPPLNFSVVLDNTGNIQEEPSGTIIITDMFGKAVAGMNINIPPHNILPDSMRKFTALMDKTVLGNKRLFGPYTAKLTVTYGTGTNQKKTLTDTIHFWIIPFKLIAIIIVLLIVAFFLIRHWLRRYKRRIIKQTGSPRTHRPVKRRRM